MSEQPQPAPVQLSAPEQAASQLPTADSVSAPAALTGLLPALVVGIGGSAGALDAYERFFVGLPLGSQMAFVVISHLDPHQESLMPEILQRCTVLNVEAIRDGVALRADSIYVAPPGFSVTLRGGVLQLQPLPQAKGHTIDAFLTSLAADQGQRAAGVILSGMGKDGTAGAQALKAAGGRVLVQDPDTAEFDAMPRSASAAGVADAVLPAEELAARLYGWVNAKPLASELEAELEAEPSQLHKMLMLVRSRTGHDFSGYKPATLVRRIDRRMKGQRIAALAEYLQVLEETPGEVEALFQDLTINVTRFFRDPDAFEQLKEHLRSTLLQGPPQNSVRVWVPGCASGEEAYSLAILLHELMEELGRPLNVQIFATDIDQQAINSARLGLYPLNIAHVVSAQRLQRYFRRSEEGYQIQGFIRESVVFALHNTFSDPPFTRLDLLCCRNMLIYFKAELQQRVLAVFHYALSPGGLLFLGTSETLGTQREHFAALDSHWRIYRRGPEAARPLPSGQIIPRDGRGLSREASPFQGVLALPPQRTLSQQAQRVLLSQYAPPAVVINASGDILFVNGQTGRYLQLPSGSGSPNNVLEMVKDGLRYDLAGGVREVQREQREVVVRHQALTPDGPLALEITLRPLHGSEQGLVIIVFREQSGPAQPLGVETEQLDRVQSLMRELQHTRETLQANIEEMLISVEELKSTNEEYQTTIEELKSTNEELMTSKEELQSLNEELITSNSEHQLVITELGQANDDMNNLLESAGIATLFLGNDLKIKRFTPKFASVIHLLPSDIGRPISDFHLKLNYPHVLRDIGQVLETLLPFETQVQTQDSRWHLLRITPYRTGNNFIDGVVVALTDLDVVKKLEAQVRISARYVQALLEGLPDPVIVFDHHQRLVTANPALDRWLPDAAPNSLITDLSAELGTRDVQTLLDQVIGGHRPEPLLLDFPSDLSGGGQAEAQPLQRFRLSAWPISVEAAQPPLYLLLLETLSLDLPAKEEAQERQT